METVGERKAGPQGPGSRKSFKELLKLNKPDWVLLLVAWVAASLTGSVFPILGILSGYYIRVSKLFMPTSPLHIESIVELHKYK